MERLLQALREVAGTYRPYHLVPVISTARWTDTGPSWITVQLGFGEQEVYYADGREPVIGELVQVVKMNDRLDSDWLALPLPLDAYIRPLTCADSTWYTMGKSSSGQYHVLKFTSITGVGDLWQFRSVSPNQGGGGYEPQLMMYPANDTFDHPYGGLPDGGGGFPEDGTYPRMLTYSRGGEAFYSDDLGLTWTSCGISPGYISPSTYFGHMYACTPSELLESTDFGATWSAIPDSAPPHGDWLYVGGRLWSTSTFDEGGNPDYFDQTTFYLRGGNTIPDKLYRGYIQAVATSGIWFTINAFNHFAYPVDADPPFDSGDADEGTGGTGTVRGWNNPSSDEGEFTPTQIDYLPFPVIVHTDFPFIVTKEYRNYYGPFGEADIQPNRAFESTTATIGTLGYVRPTAVTDYQIFIPPRAALEAATDPYDDTDMKPADPYTTFSYGSDEAHINQENSSGISSLLCIETSDVGGIAGGIEGGSVYINDYNHPGFITGLTVLDACSCGGGSGFFTYICDLVALDDDVEGEGHTSLVIARRGGSTFFPTAPWGSATRNSTWYDATQTMRHDLDEYYTFTRNGLCAYNSAMFL